MRICEHCFLTRAKFVCCSPDAFESRFVCAKHVELHVEVCPHKGSNMIVPLEHTIHGGE